MTGKTTKLSKGASTSTPGAGLRERVESCGFALSKSFTALLASTPGRKPGPQSLASLLGITIVTASRLMRAINQANPVAVVAQIPGAAPLRKTIDAAASKGAPAEQIAEARAAVKALDELILNYTSNRSSLNAMISSWVPEGRREFERRRRQAAFTAFKELRGVCCDLEFSTIILHPSETEGAVDLLATQGMLGLDRIRPDTVVQIGNIRMLPKATPEAEDLPATPLTLEGLPAVDGMHSTRLDQFCSATPAPLTAAHHGPHSWYMLGETGFGPDSSVDHVIAELNRAELKSGAFKGIDNAPWFMIIPTVPARALQYDIIIHRDLYPNGEPELLVYDTSARGPAVPHSAHRAADLLETSDEIEFLGSNPAHLRSPEFPRYLELLDYAFDKVNWSADDFKAYRLSVPYPLHASQMSLIFRSPKA